MCWHRIYTGQSLRLPTRHPRLEPPVTNFLLAHAAEDAVFMDAGAAQGYFSVVLSPHVRRVIAVEPQADRAKALRETVDYNGLENVEVHEVGLFSGEGHAVAGLCKTWPGSMTVAESGFPLITIDALMDGEPLHLAKIDVDGPEVSVLEGALRTIAEYHPIMVIEVHPRIIKERFNQDPLEILEILWQHDYRVEMLAGPRRPRIPVAARLRDCGDTLHLGAT